jgi:uncharacterized peroxidase-related enzyme
VEQIKTDYRAAGLDERTQAMLDFAVVMTTDQHHITQDTIEGLRRQGLSDEDILNVAEVTGFFNYYTRLADALGVEPEDFMVRHRPG